MALGREVFVYFTNHFFPFPPFPLACEVTPLKLVLTRNVRGVLYGWTEEDYEKRIFRMKRIGLV